MCVMCAVIATSALVICKSTRGKSTMPRQQSYGQRSKRFLTKHVFNSILNSFPCLCCLFFNFFFANDHFDVQTIQLEDPCKYAQEGCKKSHKNLKDWNYYNHLEKVHGEVVIVTEPVRRQMVSTFPESEDEDDCEEHNPVPGPSREPSS
ncbi:hypothetical protein PGTUg99_019641 [Puccinia graminis f. sp. tritici]|uniref:C2H2-type domain-containing protein n=1 Tax=Puccinia graminis f. sp. tritici TaxID=56615 RepID=A0A5B0R682_PUCGR|nr:hypothetical protein PGTUg99_019641 [Puccinia graminis f. sp. tritici]